MLWDEPVSGVRARQKAQTKAEVLAAARALFAERGFDGATARAVAERAGVSVGTVFVHYKDKQALLEACLEDHIEKVLDDAFATVPDTGVVGELVYVATRLFESYGRDPDLAIVLVKESVFSLPDESGERVHGGQLRRFQGWLQDRLTLAVERGELSPGTDPSLVFFSFFSFYLSVLAAALRRDVPFEALPALLDTLLRQLSCFSQEAS